MSTPSPFVSWVQFFSFSRSSISTCNLHFISLCFSPIPPFLSLSLSFSLSVSLSLSLSHSLSLCPSFSLSLSFFLSLSISLSISISLSLSLSLPFSLSSCLALCPSLAHFIHPFCQISYPCIPMNSDFSPSLPIKHLLSISFLFPSHPTRSSCILQSSFFFLS